MRLPVLSGREVSDRDDARSPAVVMLNEQAAHVFWPGESPIGKRIALDGKAGQQPAWMTVIGIVANARLDDMISPPYPEMYLPALPSEVVAER